MQPASLYILNKCNFLSYPIGNFVPSTHTSFRFLGFLSSSFVFSFCLILHLHYFLVSFLSTSNIRRGTVWNNWCNLYITKGFNFDSFLFPKKYLLRWSFDESHKGRKVNRRKTLLLAFQLGDFLKCTKKECNVLLNGH